MNNSLKFGLLGVIAVALIANGYFLWSNSNGESTKDQILAAKKNDAANKVNDTKTLDANDLKNKKAKVNDKTKVVNDIPSGPLTSYVFGEMAHDFGDIEQNTVNEKIFEFTNTGTEPLIISKAKGSCGCTVPDYPKEPINPGESGEIKVVFKPGKKKGNQNQTVTLTANTEPVNTVLRIKANVLVPEEVEG